MSSLASRWPLPATGLRDQLLAAYAEPSRSYHNLEHLAEVFAHLDQLGELGLSWQEPAVTLAAWFHDAVYDGRPEPEQRSAQWAMRGLGIVGVDGETVAEVARLVRLTTTHRAEPEDENGIALCDADLAILAAEPARYVRYANGVRVEYQHYDDATFAAGRLDVLESLLAAPQLFNSPEAQELWEARARANITQEIRGLASWLD